MSAPTVYIVSGFMRSCTSAMMRCLEAGGLPAVYSDTREDLMAHLSDESYEMNPKFYEIMPGDFKGMKFLSQCREKVVKLLAPGLCRLPPGPIYRIIFMLRHPVEIHASYNAAFERQTNESIARGSIPYVYPPSPGVYYFTASRVINECRMKGFLVATVGARSMVKRPMRTFTKLAHEHGWPVEPFLAAAKVEPERFRFKLEELEVRDYEWEGGRFHSPHEDFGPAWPRIQRVPLVAPATH